MNLLVCKQEAITDDICEPVNPSGPSETSPQSKERTLR
jgi:hypothetical protein